MIKQYFEINESKILKSIKGNRLEKICYTEPVFGSIKLIYSDFAIIISNEMHEANLIGEEEEITFFTITKKSKDYDFRYFKDNDIIKEIDINEKVSSVEIVNDLIIYNNEYEISYDVAIIINTKKHSYTISRDWFYMETMEISIDKDIDDILDKETIVEQYRGESTEIPVLINRTKRFL